MTTSNDNIESISFIATSNIASQIDKDGYWTRRGIVYTYITLRISSICTVRTIKCTLELAHTYGISGVCMVDCVGLIGNGLNFVYPLNIEIRYSMYLTAENTIRFVPIQIAYNIVMGRDAFSVIGSNELTWII